MNYFRISGHVKAVMIIPFLITMLIRSTCAVAGDVPRMWKVTEQTGQGHTFYILPVTHNGSDQEYDGYFYKTVLPTAIGADVYFHEKALLIPEKMPPCRTPLAPTEENRRALKRAYEEVEGALYGLMVRPGSQLVLTDEERTALLGVKHWLAHDGTSRLTEYGLIVSMQTTLYNTLRHHPDAMPREAISPNPVVTDYIARERSIKGGKINESIDSAQDIVDMYCEIDGKNRGKYLLREIAKADPRKMSPLPDHIYEELQRDFVTTLKTGRLSGALRDVDGDEFSRNAVCQRNDKWLDKMTKFDGRISFYALGFAHVFQPGSNSDRCDGLLESLRKRAYSVKLVE